MANRAPWLVIMAAGMGSRFGGLKQITPVDEQGHIIIDFSLYDAWRAGFRNVAFIIKREIEADFRSMIIERIEKYFRVAVIYQDIDNIPEGFCVPQGREKPWGTGHAVACCRGVVDGPFAVINADDFYGGSSFRKMYEFLSSSQHESSYAMIGYLLRNTVTENGSVARGVCTIEDGMLTGVTERTKIFKRGDDAEYVENGTAYPIGGDTIVSMNFWGFSREMLDVLWAYMPEFLRTGVETNPLKCEYFLPSVVNAQLKSGKATVRVLPCTESWYGVTYREDLEGVCKAIREMKRKGIYTEKLWQ